MTDTEQAIETAVTDVRKNIENTAKQHINSIWQDIEDAAKWPLHKLEELIADLKKHV